MRIDRLSMALLLGAALCTASAFAQTAATVKTGAAARGVQTPSTVAPKTGVHKGGPTQNASTADIANAKTKGMVWVNTSTGVYHKDGEYFGATKQGKFMTEAEAQKAGYRSAKDPVAAAKNAKAAKAKVK